MLRSIKVQNSKFKTASIVALLFAFCFLNAAETPEALYKQAANFYKANDFAKAAASYENILTQDLKSAEVYYNLGNCYYKLNNLGRAVLNYERALKLAPNDEDIKHNLQLALHKTVDKIQPVPQLSIVTWWQSFTNWQSAKGWNTFAIVALWLAFAVFAVYLFIGFKRITTFVGSFLLILSIAFVSLAFKQNKAEQYSDEAVLMVTSVYVKSAPDTNGNDIFVIHEGLKFRLLDNVGNWHKIRLADGKTGWLQSTAFSRI
ncbi:MAG: tetratricopeptide repeat protein [Chitinophagales bacterium]|nr:tetratricopeptide repeat protein [Chitinophagales bacterium]